MQGIWLNIWVGMTFISIFAWWTMRRSDAPWTGVRAAEVWRLCQYRADCVCFSVGVPDDGACQPAMASGTDSEKTSVIRIVSGVASKPIRVDNWGNFLAQRIEALYDKQEHCDLTLRFPHGDLKVTHLDCPGAARLAPYLSRAGWALTSLINFAVTTQLKETNPYWKKLSKIPELYAKMLRTFFSLLRTACLEVFPKNIVYLARYCGLKFFGRGGWGKLAGGVKWPPPPVR